MHCSTGQGKIASLLFSVALQNRLTACLCHCNYTYGDLLFVKVCGDATPMHCSTGQGKIASLLFSVALQNRLTAALNHFNYTCGVLHFIQVCCDARPMHCSTGQGKIASLLFSVALSLLLSATLQTRQTAALSHYNTPLEFCPSYRCAVMQDQCTAALVRAK